MGIQMFLGSNNPASKSLLTFKRSIYQFEKNNATASACHDDSGGDDSVFTALTQGPVKVAHREQSHPVSIRPPATKNKPHFNALMREGVLNTI